MTKLGILVAMSVECRSLTTKRVPQGGCLELDQHCLIGLSGAGPAAADRCVDLLIQAGAKSLISWGCAAALAPGIHPGDLILPDRIACKNGQLIETDESWRKRLTSKLEGQIHLYSGLLAESDRIVARADEKQAIHATKGAIALDMESAAVARAAERHRMPFLAIRSVVDPVDVTLPPSIEGAFDDKGILHVRKMLLSAFLHPVDFIDIIQLGRHFDAAMKTLKLAADMGRDTNFAVA